MGVLEKVTENFTRRSREILGDNLVGIYLRGSAAMDCFNEKKSDIDLLTVVDRPISDEEKRKYMDMAAALNADAPEKE